MTRKMEDKTYLKYLLQSLNVDNLKQICRNYQIKGFSRLKKIELIDFILDSLSEEELSNVLEEKELEIIKESIDLAIKKINGEDRESVSAIKIVNPDTHEIELDFKGFNWEVSSYIAITLENIDDPERDCDCRIGSNMGFCSHFWVGFIVSLKEGYLNLKEWNLTVLPDDFEEKVKSIKIKAGESISLVDESSEDYHLMENLNKSITVYEGEVEELIEKQQDFQGNITIYYITKLKNVRFGPRVQKKSDFREEDIVNVDKLNLRISERLKKENDLEIGNKISGNGKLTKDNFLKMFIVKNIRKIEKI